MVLYICKVEIEIIYEYQVIGKLQYTRIYGKLKRRNKLRANDKFNNDNHDNKTDNGYLCGGYSNSREIFNFIDNNLGSCKPDLLRVYFKRI